MNRIIKAITDFIFVEDTPQKSDVIMVVGGSYPEAAEIAAKQNVYNKNYADECEFYTDVLLKNGVDKSKWYLIK